MRPVTCCRRSSPPARALPPLSRLTSTSARRSCMPTRGPKSYDDIVRATVPDPDSSWRPTLEQERAAYEGFRDQDPDELALAKRVHAALAASGLDVAHVTVEIDGDRVVLGGKGRDPDALMKIPGVVGQVDGVSAVVDQRVIAP